MGAYRQGQDRWLPSPEKFVVLSLVISPLKGRCVNWRSALSARVSECQKLKT